MIRVKDLTKIYGKSNTVFKDLCMIFKEGITCLYGRSGCGKTTLVRIIAGLEKANGGQVEGICGKVSFMFQENRLFDGFDAVSNASSVKPECKTEARKLLLSLGFKEEDLTKKPTELSGGMCRRVALARVILFDKYFGGNTVILDEPFKGLDSETKRLAADTVTSAFADKHLIVITHDEDDALMLEAERLNFPTLFNYAICVYKSI